MEEETAGTTLEQSWVALQRKAAVYENMKHDAFDEDPETATVMVDFLKKAAEEKSDDEADQSKMAVFPVNLVITAV